MPSTVIDVPLRSLVKLGHGWCDAPLKLLKAIDDLGEFRRLAPWLIFRVEINPSPMGLARRAHVGLERVELRRDDTRLMGELLEAILVYWRGAQHEREAHHAEIRSGVTAPCFSLAGVTQKRAQASSSLRRLSNRSDLR